MLALIDGDALVYRLSFRYQKKVFFLVRNGKRYCRARNRESAIDYIADDESFSIEEDYEYSKNPEVITDISNIISSILYNTNCDTYKVFLSCGGNFRYSLATLKPYKGHRASEKPKFYSWIRDILLDRGAIVHDGLEADDCLSCYATNISESVICTNDKDLLTVPSTNFNLNTSKITVVSKADAMLAFWKQVMIGDVIDNIPSPSFLGEGKVNKCLAGLKLSDDLSYYERLMPLYNSYLNRKCKDGTYRTAWYDGSRSTDSVLWEIGNLVYMHRTLDPNERWSLPNGEKGYPEEREVVSI